MKYVSNRSPMIISTGQVDLVSHTDISVNIISVSNPCHFAGFGFRNFHPGNGSGSDLLSWKILIYYFLCQEKSISIHCLDPHLLHFGFGSRNQIESGSGSEKFHSASHYFLQISKLCPLPLRKLKFLTEICLRRLDNSYHFCTTVVDSVLKSFSQVADTLIEGFACGRR